MKKSRLLGAVSACLIAACLSTSTSAAVSAYAQDFEALDAGNPSALGPFGDGYQIWADVWGSGSGDATVGSDIFLYGYGPFAAPNGGPGFSAIAGGEGGVDQGDQYLNIYSDYNNPDQTAGGACGPTGCTINTSVFQEYTIDAGDIGSVWTLEFDSKSPFANGIFDGTAINGQNPPGDYNNPQSASAFIKTLDPSNGYWATNDIRVDMTTVSNTDWGTYSIQLDLSDPALAGQLLQFGFNTVSTEYGDSGVYYDNVSFTSAVPVPAAVWLFGSGLLGLVGITRRKKA